MILNKLIIHLKNVLFFKAVIYVLLIIGLVLLNPIANNDLQELLQKRDKARTFLDQATLKFESIQDFENKIVDMHSKYKDLATINGKQGCKDRSAFIAGLRSFVNQKENQRKFDNLHANIREVNKLTSGFRESYNVRIKPYEGVITLKARDYLEFSKFLEYLSDTLPAGALITKCEIKSQKTLTPDVIKNLAVDKKPLLFYAKITVLFREINYDQ